MSDGLGKGSTQSTRWQLCAARLIGVALALACVQPARAQNFGPFTLTADNFTNFVYPDDSQIDRNVTVTNNTGQEEDLEYQDQGGIAESTPTCNPQPNFLYIPPNGSVLIECEIGLPGPNVFTVGNTTNVPMSIQVSGGGVQGTINVNTNVTGVDLSPNATLTGTVTDSQTGQPIAEASIQVASMEGMHNYYAASDASGSFSIPVVAHQRTFLGNWVEQIISVTASGYDTHQSIAIPETGQTVNVQLLLRRRGFGQLNYVQTMNYNARLPIGRGAMSADGHYLATAPFWDNLANVSDAYVAANAQLDFFDTVAAKLLWSKTIGVKMWWVDVSDDGNYVLICNPGPNPDQYDDNFPGFIAYDRSGNVYLQYNIPGAGPQTGCVDAKFSHDDSLIAYGTEMGNIGLYDVASQTVLWTGFLGGMVRSIAFSQDDSTIFFSSGDNNLYALNASTGAQLWQTYINGWAHSLMMSTNWIGGTGKSGRALSILNQSDGSVVWQYPLEVQTDGGAITVAQDGVMVASPQEDTMIFNGAGVPQWSILGGPATPPPRYVLGASAGTFSPDGNYVGLLAANAFVAGPNNSWDQVQLYSRAGDLLWSDWIYGQGPWKVGEAGVFFFTPDDQRLLIGSPTSGTVSIFRRMPP